jgi:hypothetical protein
MAKGMPTLGTNIESGLRLFATAAFFAWNLVEGAYFENQYPLAMVSLYEVPIWRLAFLVLIVLAADWCPSTALMLGFFIFFYIMDMEVTHEKWSMMDLKGERAG